MILACPLFGTKRTSACALHMSAFGGKADIRLGPIKLLIGANWIVRFSIVFDNPLYRS